MRDTPLIMGILNTTPDSFFDGGSYASPQTALQRARDIIEQGAAIIDIGGYSTRPSAPEVSPQEERARVIPLLNALKKENLPAVISVDSFTPSVIKEALDTGANIVNDASGLENEELAKLAAQYKAKLVIMHTRGNPRNMQTMTEYKDILAEISAFFDQKIQLAAALGLERKDIILDVGLGFAKTREQNWFLLENMAHFNKFNLPLLVGASRKSFTDKTLELSLKAAKLAKEAKADIIRVHDVKETARFIRG